MTTNNEMVGRMLVPSGTKIPSRKHPFWQLVERPRKTDTDRVAVVAIVQFTSDLCATTTA